MSGHISSMMSKDATGRVRGFATLVAWFIFATFMVSNGLAMTDFDARAPEYLPPMAGATVALVVKFLA